MITLDHFPTLLLSLGFVKNGSTYTKNIHTALLEVDTAKAEIRYPAGGVINERAKKQAVMQRYL